MWGVSRSDADKVHQSKEQREERGGRGDTERGEAEIRLRESIGQEQGCMESVTRKQQV